MVTPTFMNLKQSYTKDIQSLTTKEKCLTNKSDLSSPVAVENGENASQSATEKSKWKWRKNKKRKCKEQLSVQSDKSPDKPSSGNPAIKRKQDDNNDSVQPAKKRRKKKKKKSAEQEENSAGTSEYKTVLIVRKPEDYSANWKQLKEMLAEENKKEGVQSRENRPNTYRRKKKTDPVKNASDPKSDTNKETGVDKKKKLGVWFDNVDPVLLENDEAADHKKGNNIKRNTGKHGKRDTATSLEKKTDVGKTKIMAMDCEMVGVGFQGEESILARVSIVNYFGKVLYDTFVKPTEKVTDYRTHVSGVRPDDVKEAPEFAKVQKEVSDLLSGRILVGHALRHDLKVLFLSHPTTHIRDTSRYKYFRRMFGGRTPGLKKLTEKVIGLQIQHGEHSSVQDAQAAMRLYTLHRREWEKQIIQKKKRKSSKILTTKSAETGKKTKKLSTDW